ncbi:MAG: DsbA family protein [Chloroflexaceae bacterium]|nr:DsbA family protein [Chloroflexaceae bacterium]
MSVQPSRGRKVPGNEKKTLRIFYIGIGVVALAGIALLIAFAVNGDNDTSQASTSATPNTNTPGESTGSAVALPSDQNNVDLGRNEQGFYYRGSIDAPVTVIEYSDFECPACANFVTSSLYRELVDNYVNTGKVHFIFHDFPLPYHQATPLALQASRCAGEQGKFWEMHDLLFQRQAEWSRGNTAERLMNYAAQIELDGEAFQSCFSSGKYAPYVDAAHQAASAANIPATPTFVVNGQQVNASQLLPAIDAALAGQ